MKTIERIKQFIDYKKISLTSFDEKIGAGNAYIGKQIKKSASIGSDMIEKIVCAFDDLDVNWLITGEGEMIKQKIIYSTDLPKASVSESPVNYITETKKSIPLVLQEAIAGIGNFDFSISEKDIQARYIVPDFQNIDFMIRVSGDSMHPKYTSGDVVACRIIKERTFVQWNKVHVIATKNQGSMIKRLKKGSEEHMVNIVSDNVEYDPFEVSWSEITGIALVVGVIRLE